MTNHIKIAAEEAMAKEFWGIYNEQLEKGRVRNLKEFAAGLGVAPSTVSHFRISGRISAKMLARAREAFAEELVQVPRSEYDRMRECIANLSATVDRLSRLVATPEENAVGE